MKTFCFSEDVSGDETLHPVLHMVGVARVPLISGTQGHLQVWGWLVTTAELWQQPVCVKGPCGCQCPRPALVVTMSHVHLPAPGRWPQKFWSWKGKGTYCRGKKALSWHGRRLKEELCGFGPEQILQGWVWPATSGEISLWGPLILGTDE